MRTALLDVIGHVDRVLVKACFWRCHAAVALLPAQVKVLNRLLEGGHDNLEHGISASQYQRVARVSKATATRHLAGLLAHGHLEKQAGGGRSTHYRIRHGR